MVVSVTVDPGTPKQEILWQLMKKIHSQIEATNYSEGRTIHKELVVSLEVNLRE